MQKCDCHGNIKSQVEVEDAQEESVSNASGLRLRAYAQTLLSCWGCFFFSQDQKPDFSFLFLKLKSKN